MYFTIVFLLFVYLITLTISLALYFSSLELMGRFLVVLIPVFIGVISNFRDLAFKSQTPDSRSFTLFMITYSVLMTLLAYYTIQIGSHECLLEDLLTFEQFFMLFVNRIKKLLSFFGLW